MTVDALSQLEEQRYRAVLAIDLTRNGAADPLVTALHDESWRVRKVAAERISQLPGVQDAVQKLMRVLAERGQPGARNSAAEALVRIGGPAVPSLVALLGHPDPDQRKFAADILGLMEARDGEAPLVAAIDDPDLNVAVAAAEALGQIGGEWACRALMRVLKRPEALIRLSALEGLAFLRRPPPMPELVALLADAKLQRSVLRCLGLVQSPAAIEIICRSLASEVRSVREAALAALGQQWMGADGTLRAELETAARAAVKKVSAAPEVVLAALESENIDVKAGALFLAAAVKDPKLSMAVAEAATDDRLVREVSWALARLGPHAFRELTGRLQALSLPARAAVAEALVEIADASWLPTLSELLASGEEELQMLAIRALARSQAKEAVGPLVGRLADPVLGASAGRALSALGEHFADEVARALEQTLDAAPTASAVVALARVRGSAAKDRLEKALRASDDDVRAAAAEASVELAIDDRLELARRALTDESPRVRLAAVKVLGSLDASRVAPLLERALADEDATVQTQAIDAVAECGAVQLEASLAPALLSDGLRASRAVRALAKLGRLTADALDRAASHADVEVVKEALVHGATMAEGVALAIRLIGHARWDVRAAAARVLGASGDALCLPKVKAAIAVEKDPITLAALEDAAARLAER